MCLVFLTMGITAQTTVTIGTGATIASAGTNGDPIYRSSGASAYHYSKSVQLLTAADLATASVVSGASINSIGYYKTTAFNVSGSNAWTLNVYLKNSSATGLVSGTAWDTMISGATLFYSATINNTNNFPAAADWVTFTNNTANTFSYTGGAIEVYIDWVPSGTLTSPYTGGAFQWKYDTTTSAQAMGTSNSAAIAGTNTSYTTQTRRYQTQLTYTAIACSGAPNPGNALASATSGTCSTPYSTTLSLQNSTTGTGVSYQWYNNAGAIAGATSSIYTTTISAADSFYCAVTCSGSGITTNSGPISVSGPPAAISPNYTNDFATFPGGCWSLANGGTPATGPGTGTSNYWAADGFLNSGTTGAAKINLYTTGRQGWLKSPAFNLSAGGYRVKFDYGLTSYAATTSSTMGSDDVVQFVVSTDGGTTWMVLQTWDASNTPSNTLNTYVFDLSNFLGNNTIFAIYGSDGTVDDAQDYEFFVDNFVVESIPACDTPTGLTSSLITHNSATISWTALGTAPANGYEYYYSTTNSAPASGTATTAVSQNLISLLPQTIYYYWVRSMCAGTQSAWVSGTFTTLATPPVNDNCSSAVNLTVNPDYACGAITSGTTVSATASTETAPTCAASGTNDDVWYKFTATNTAHRVTLSNVSGSTDMAMAAYSGSCGSLVHVLCSDPNTMNLTGLTVGEEYKVRVWTYTSTVSTTATFDICVGTPPPPSPPPANDNCSSAVNLTVGGAFAQNAVTGTTVGATNTPALTASCLTAPTNVAGNVWYKIVVPASGSVTIETDTDTGTALDDTVMSVFADCTSTTSVTCDDDTGNGNFSKVVLTGQTPGATLYVSVWRYSNAGGGTDGTFKISAYDSSLLATSEVSAAKNEVKAYPNPFADVLNISDISKVKSVSVVDLAGRLVKTIDNPSSALQLGDLKQGMYLVTLNMKDGSKQTIKAIKK